MNNEKEWLACLCRMAHTVWESACAAAVVAIGQAGTLEAVSWRQVASTALLAGLLSFLKSAAVGTPEGGKQGNT